VGRHEETASSKKDEPTLEGLVASHKVDAWILCLPEKEKSPDPAFLRIDWRLRGAITRALDTGAVSRASGDVSLLPITRTVSDQDRQTFKILALGVKSRDSITNQEVSQLLRNIEGLRLKCIGLSASDFGWAKADVKKHLSGLKGVELCVTE